MNRPRRPAPHTIARDALRTYGMPIAALLLAAGSAWLLWSGLSTGGTGTAGEAIPEGMRGVPVAAVELPAYTEIALEHLLDPRTGQLAAVVLPEESILASTIVDPKDLVGRVLARRKAAARVFREEDFLPVGTRPGIVAGIPAGKRALRIDASKVSGLAGLQQGDRFDLFATYRGDATGGAVPSIYGGGGAAGGASARSRLISENGAVVTALSSRAQPVPGRGEQIVQEMVIALAPEEVPLVTEALEVAKRIDCIPRSGLPGADDAPGGTAFRTPAARAGEEPIVDLIEGDRRSLRRIPETRATVAVPDVGAGPLARDPSNGG